MSYENPRIELTDSVINMLRKMAGGNPGAINVLSMLINEDIDKDSAMGGVGNVLSLDTLNIYEDRIWVLFKDVCGENLEKMIAVLRGHQLGILTKHDIDGAISGNGSINTDEILSSVKGQLKYWRSPA